MFKSDASRGAGKKTDNTEVLLKAAGSVAPINELTVQNRGSLCRSATVQHLQRNDQVKQENAHRFMMYLVDGSVNLMQGKDEVGSLTAGTPEAAQPLFENKSYQSLKAGGAATLVKFGREQYDILLREQQKNSVHVLDVEVGPLDNLIFDDIINDIQVNKISLACFNENTTRITSVLTGGGQVAIPELAEMIQTDPGLSSHIVLAANRAEGNGGDAIQSIRGAISRLGIESTMQTLVGLLKSNSMQPGNAAIEARFRRYIQRSSLASVIMYVLAKDLPHLNPDVAQLAALTSDIGELMLLTYANRHAEQFEDREKLVGVVNNLGEISSSWLLRTWDFAPVFVECAETSRQWYRNHTGDISYADLNTAALLIIQSEMPDEDASSIPSADNLLLARRLQQAGIDILAPAKIMQEATTRLVGIQNLLKAS